MAELASFRAIVHGQVQGVFFRDFTRAHAVSFGLTGYVRNLPDGRTVGVVAEGDREKLERLADYLKVGPPGARVVRVETNWAEYTGSYTDFRVRH